MKCLLCKSISTSQAFLSGTVECSRCGLIFLTRISKPSYSSKYFKQSTKQTIFAKLASPILKAFYRRRIAKIRSLLNSQKNSAVLDYGCGSGKLVRQLNVVGIKTLGYEPSSGAQKLAAKEKLPVFGSLSSFNKKFDLIMFWHSLEHTTNPLEVISKAKTLLKKEGKLLIAVPNVDSLEAKIAKEAWFHFSRYFHPIYFSPKSLKYLLSKQNLKISEIDYLNLEYTFSGLIQTFLNLILPRDMLYSVISHRRFTLNRKKTIYYSLVSVLLLMLFSPLLIMFFLIQLVSKKTGAIIVIT